MDKNFLNPRRVQKSKNELLENIRPFEYNDNGCFVLWRTMAMEYMTANQAAKLWRISQRRVQILFAEDRIPGVFKLGEAWAIPADAEKPVDPRRTKKIKKDE